MLLFLASRFYILFLAEIRGSTVFMVDVPYASAWDQAGSAAAYYAEVENLKHQFDDRPENADPPPDEAEYRVEYPPLAIAWMRVPYLLVPPLTSGVDLREAMREAVLYSRSATACFDLFGLVVLALLLPRLFPGDPMQRPLRLVLYIAGGVILFHLLYDRLDLPVGVLIAASVWLLIGRWHYLLSFLVLAVVINYKLTPGMLAPIWILGAMPAAMVAGSLTRQRVVRIAAAAFVRALWLGALTIAIFLPFYQIWGEGTLDFFEYHARRGLQIESTWATALFLVGRLTGKAPSVVQNFGAYHLHTPAAAALSAVSPWVTMLLLGLATVSFWLSVRRRLAAVADQSRTVAQLAPDLIVGYSVLFLLVAIASAKVLSPQYFLWLIPLMPLLDWRGGLNRSVPVAYLVILLLTTLLFPYIYFTRVARALVEGQAFLRMPPTRLALAVLLARNLLLIAMAAAVWAGVRRDPEVN